MIKNANKKVISLLFSALAGMCLALMIRVNASLGEHIGALESSFVVHVVGFLFAALVLFRQLNKNLISNIKSTPKYMLCGGFLGVGMVLIANYLVPIIGMVLTISLFITCSMIFSTVGDHFGLFGLQKFRVTGQRVLGLGLALSGVILLFWK